MHRHLRELLPDAKSDTGFVVAMNLDIRGFSAFAAKMDAAFAMVFLKKVFIRLIDDYVPENAFFKLTGDGMLIVREFDEGELMDALTEAVRRSLSILKEFPKLCSDDPMIPFETPKLVGIGLAWGTASSLRSGNRILDYSGQPLNLASRLMEVARPSGLVFDRSFPLDRFPTELAANFATDDIYLKGVAEDAPLTVHYTNTLTEIPAALRRPIARRTWGTTAETVSFKELEVDWAKYTRHRVPLTEEPLEPDSLTCRISHPSLTAQRRRHPTDYTHDTFPAEYADDWGYPAAVVNYQPIVKMLKARGIRSNWPITVTFRYSIP